MLTPLPVRPQPAPDEAMDSYMERVATANGFTTRHFTLELTARAEAPLRFTTIAPPPPLLDVLSSWTNVDRHRLQDCLLTRYPVVPTVNSEHRHGTRSVVAHGWVLLNRSQACPQCLAETGIWKSTWRLSWVTACLIHRCLLETDCPGCRKPLRTAHHGELRPAGAGSLCGNPRTQGRGMQCTFDLARMPPHSASEDILYQQRRVEDALHGADVDMPGTSIPGRTYLGLVQTLTPLVLHRPRAPSGNYGRTSTDHRLLANVSHRWVHPAPRAPRIRAAAGVRIDQELATRAQTSSPSFTGGSLLPATSPVQAT